MRLLNNLISVSVLHSHANPSEPEQGRRDSNWPAILNIGESNPDNVRTFVSSLKISGWLWPPPPPPRQRHRPRPRPRHSHNRFSPVDTVDLGVTAVQRLGCNVDHWPLSSAEVRNE